MIEFTQEQFLVLLKAVYWENWVANTCWRGNDIFVVCGLEAGEIIGIQVLDHVVIGKELLFSFRENGFLQEASLKDTVQS